MYYYELWYTAPFCGTDTFEIYASKSPLEMTDEWEKEIRSSLVYDYSYLIHGWRGKDPTDDEIDEFYDDCEIEFKEISYEEFAERVYIGFAVQYVN